MSMTKKVPVTVIVTTYESPRLAESIASIENQINLPEEVVVIDDASLQPECVAYLERLSCIEFDFTLRVERLKENLGPSGARNVGLSIASHDFVAFLDAGDVWTSDKISLQYNWMLANPEFVLTGHYHNYEKLKDGRRIEFHNILKKNYLATPTIMLRKESACTFDETMKYSEDHKFLIEMCLRGPIYKMGFMGCILERAVNAPGGLSERKWLMRLGQLSIYTDLRRKKIITVVQELYYKALCLSKHAIKSVLPSKLA